MAQKKVTKLNKIDGELLFDKESGLNLKQTLFCQLFASDREFFGNGVESYIEAYEVDLTKQNAYQTARSSASQLLTKRNILDYINKLLSLAVLNDEFVDKQLSVVILQNADFSSKVSAIKEYNKLKQRIQDKLDITSGGKPLPILGGLSNVPTKPSDQKDSTATQ